MLHGNWEQCNKTALEKLIAEKAFSDNYAVFDWDFTCIFFDVQDSLFLHQIEQLYFRLTPEAFSAAIRKDVPPDIPLKQCFNSEGTQLTAAMLSTDLDLRYRFLYDMYENLGGSAPLSKVIATAEYRDFQTKLLKLVFTAVSICTTDISQTLSAGMSVAELGTFVEQAIDSALNEEIAEYSIVSPAELAGTAGVVSVAYRKGIRIQPEIQELFQRLQENGIEPYVCSASQEDCVRVFACHPKYGYCLKPHHIFGRRRKCSDAGILTIEKDFSTPQALKEGKAEVIKTLIAPHHSGKAPVLIAGDSDGDFYMMDAFKKDALLLIFDCHPSPEEKIYRFVQQGIIEKGNPTASIIVQQRDERTGLCIASSMQ